MSLIRIINNLFIGKKIKSFTKTFAFDPIGIVAYICSNEGRQLIAFLKEVQNGKAVDSYEAKEIHSSENLAEHIGKEEIVFLITGLIYDKQNGPEIRETLWQHRVLIHAMYYNDKYMLDQLAKIIQQLEFTVREEEKDRGSTKVIKGTGMAGMALERRNG